MTVNDAIESLQKLSKAGHGYLELIYQDTRSGDTGSVDIYDTVSEKNEGDTMGRLCEWEDGQKYVPVYTDH